MGGREAVPDGTTYQGNLSFDVNIDGGMPISNVRGSVPAQSVSHPTVSTAHWVRELVIPGDDFKLTWQAAADRIESGVVEME